MSRIRGKNTGPERMLAQALGPLGVKWANHVRELPGCPDFVFEEQRVVVFVDGDFWHGWRFSAWRDKLSQKWEDKIAANRRRDANSHRRLRRAGWKVVRIWEHQIELDLGTCAGRVAKALGLRRAPAHSLADLAVR